MKHHIIKLKLDTEHKIKVWEQMVAEAKETHEPISQYITRMLKYMKDWEDMKKTEPNFVQVMQMFPMKIQLTNGMFISQ